jgi:hypothetical protein
MKRNLLTSIFLPLLLIVAVGITIFYFHPLFSAPVKKLAVPKKGMPAPVTPTRVGAIPLPEGYERLATAKGSFAEWLQNIRVKKDNTVYLYNGQPKRNQEAQYAVLDIPVGNKDLQQCADAVMRLRAQYLYGQKRFTEIWFSDNNGKKYICPKGIDSTRFERYLENVYTYCGTLSLEKQLRPVTDISTIQPGDVLIKGGSPGHAVIVLDVAKNKEGKKIYLIAQSYMPAQDIHVLKDPIYKNLSPWYWADTDNPFIYTPEWTFSTKQLKRW